MGNLLDLFTPLIQGILYLLYGQEVASFEEMQTYEYAVQDPTQLVQPDMKSLDYVSSKYRQEPAKLDVALHKSCDTLWKCFMKAVWTLPDRPFLGTRRFKKQDQSHSRKGRQFLSDDEGEYEWLTFAQVEEIVDNLSKSIINRNLCPIIKSNVQGTPDLRFIGIFAENRQEWYITELAAMSHSITVVPVAVQSQFLENKRVCQVIDQTEMQTLCVSKKTIQFILDLKANGQLPYLKSLIMFDAVDDCLLQQATQEGLELLTYQFLVDNGEKLTDILREEPTADSIFFLGVTSGTTGEPKMAMLTHKNMVSGQVCADYIGFNFTENDVYLSYVPLTHVYEQICHADALMFGFRIGYSSNGTNNLIKDMQKLRPTFFGSFPAFFNKINDEIHTKMQALQWPLRGIAEYAISSKIWYFHNHGVFQHWVYDFLIFRHVRNMLGGRVRLMCSGGAPLYADVKQMLTIAMSAPIIEAYGQTESSGNCSATAYWERKAGHVGGILPCVRMQLRELPELNTDTRANPPRGELYIKGNSVMKGYFKDPEQTAKVIDKDGWFRVGDLVTVLPNGAIQVIDRVKEYTKLQNGQYIAPQKLESIYLNAPLINQICIDVNPKYCHLVAVVTVNQDKINNMQSIDSSDDMKQNLLLNFRDIEPTILRQLDNLAAKNNLDQIQRIKRIHIANESFSYKNGFLTNTQKLKRHAILKAYRSQLDNLLDEPDIQLKGNSANHFRTY